MNQTEVDTKRLARNSQPEDLNPTPAKNKLTIQKQIKQTTPIALNKVSTEPKQTYRYKLKRGSLTPKPNKQTVSGQIKLKRVTPTLLKESPLKSSQPILYQ